MKKIISQVIDLTKNIYLKNPIDDNFGIEQFIAGKNDPFRLSNGLSITWWYTTRTIKLIENVSFMIINTLEEFSECDHQSIQKIIRSTLHEICVDNNIFNAIDVFTAKKEKLFDCRLESNAHLMGQYLLDIILNNIRSSISDWCVIYTAPRISGKSFSIDSENIHIIHKSDTVAWNKILELGYCINEISPETGNFSDGRKSPFTGLAYDYLFICLSSGTVQGSMFSAALKLRKLFSVIYAISKNENNKHRHKVMASPHSCSLQIPHKSCDIKLISISVIGDLLPYYAEDNILDMNDIRKIQKWYENEINLEHSKKERINKCAHYINKGMNSKDIESYIYFFVALDALYGKKGSVELSIKAGISELPQKNNEWNNKITWLFDLRNELVHGGSRFIEEWPKYMNYYRHFSTEPARDIEELALLALSMSPVLIGMESEPCRTQTVCLFKLGIKLRQELIGLLNWTIR